MVIKNDSGYRIMGVKDGWIISTEKGIEICSFLASRDKKSPVIALEEALTFFSLLKENNIIKHEKISRENCKKSKQ